jgi:hypothetical protein
MDYSPKTLIENYFSTPLSYNQNENITANKIIRGFEITKSADIHRFGQYVKYKTDNVDELSQTMQTIDFTLYEGTGDCEDYTRAYVKILKNMNLPAYYWLMFTNTNYTNGHALPLFLDENNHLATINYTTYYIVDTIELVKQDIDRQSTKFEQAFSILHGAIISNFHDYSINWIVKTNDDETPVGYLNMKYAPHFQEIYTKSYIQDRSLVLKYINNMNLSRNFVVSDLLIPFSAFLLFYFLSRWLK